MAEQWKLTKRPQSRAQEWFDGQPSEPTEAVKELVRAATNLDQRPPDVAIALARLRTLCPELFEEESHEAE